MSKRAPRDTKRQTRAAKRAPAISRDQQRWQAVRSDQALQRAIRMFLVERARAADPRASDSKAWATTQEVYDEVGHFDTVMFYSRSQPDRVAALLTVLHDMVRAGYIYGGQRVGSLITAGDEANVWRARLSSLQGFKYVLHVANGKVTRLRGDHTDPPEVVANPDVPANIYDITDGEIVYPNVTIYGACAAGSIERASADHRAIVAWLRITEGGGEG